MMTFAQLIAVRPDEFADVAGIIRRFAETVADRADELSTALTLLRRGWSGMAATTAFDRIAAVRVTLDDAYPGLVAFDQAVSEFAASLTDARRAAVAAATPRPGSAVIVDAAGIASIDPQCAHPDPADLTELAEVTSAITGAVRAADAADAELVRRLRSIPVAVDRDQVAPLLPTAGTDPVAVHAWWRSLTPAQQLYLVAIEPARIQELDGVPADARDQAARILVYRQQASLADQDQTLRLGPQTRSSRGQIGAIDRELQALAALRDRLNDPYSDREYLLDIDSARNRAIVSIADPDRAAHTLTFVPGVGSSLADAAGTLAAIGTIRATASTLAPSDSWSPASAGELATIGWLDYAAPPTVMRASTIGPANSAAGDLSTFEAGLRADSTQSDPHESVLGYSYGSVVVGAAAHQHGLAADDIIFVGSPGTTVHHAAELGSNPGHTWATTARTDPIRLAARPSSLLGQLLGRVPRTLWFGTDPTDPSFGARVFSSNPGSPGRPVRTHVSYFDTGTPSVQNIAMIAMGDDTDVS